MAEAPVLVEIERMLDKPLHETFELVYGTSTGAIIASMVALGDDVAETIHNRYFKLAPAVRRKRFPARQWDYLQSEQLRRIDGYQRLSEVLEHAEVAA